MFAWLRRAPVAVGTAAASSREMMTGGMKGKGINVLHTYMDQLWYLSSKSAHKMLRFNSYWPLKHIKLSIQ